jgi:hypothetical protein
MEFTKEMLKDQLHLCKKNLRRIYEKNSTQKSFKINSFLAARAARTSK